MNPKSKNLIFKKLGPEHFENFSSIAMDPVVMKYYRNADLTREGALKSFQKYQDYQSINPDLGAFAVSTLAGEFIGIGVIIHLEMKPEHGKFEIGYRLAKEAWGKGHATEIAHALIEYGFNHLKLSEIFGTTNPENKVSQKVLLKTGLIPIGEGPYWEGSEVFRLARDQWKQVRQA